MRWAVYIVGLALVVATAFWSYRMTYRTQGVFEDVAALRAEIGRERQAIGVLRAEWAWLNAPDRLERLARRHAAALKTEPMTPSQFAELAEIEGPSIDDGMEPVALIGLDELSPDLNFAPSPRPRPAAFGE